MRIAIALLLAHLAAGSAEAGPAEQERALALAEARKEGEAAERRGDHAACAAAYLRAFDIDSRQVGDELLYNAGVCFELDAEVDRALEAWRRLEARNPRSRLRPRALVRIGNLCERVARYAEAADAFEAYGTLYGGEKDARDALIEAARFRLALGDNARAIRILEHALRLVRPDRRREAAEIRAHIAALKAPRRPAPPRRPERLPERYPRSGRAADILVTAPLAAPP